MSDDTGDKVQLFPGDLRNLILGKNCDKEISRIAS